MQDNQQQGKEDVESQGAEVVSGTQRNNEDEGSQSVPDDQPIQDDDNEIKKKQDDDRSVKFRKNQQLMGNKNRLGDGGENTSEGVFLYKPGVELPNLFPFLQQHIKIIIATQYINKRNPQFLRRNISGNETYTANSDAVCIAVHTGMININNFVHKKFEGVELTCKVIRPKKNYSGVTKNGLVSKGVKNYDGNALKPQSVKNLITLPPLALLEKYAGNMNIMVGSKRSKSRPRCLSSIIPIPETHIVFNMNNEPAYKYSIFNIADKGFDKNELVIKKLDHFVLYLETDNAKYEVIKVIKELYFEFIKLSKVRNPQKADNEYFSKFPAPLPAESVQVLEEGAEWDQVTLGNTSIKVKDVEITGLRSFKYYRLDPKK